MMKARTKTIVAFLLGVAVTVGGMSVYQSRTDSDDLGQSAVPFAMFPTSSTRDPAPTMTADQERTGLDDVPTMISRLARRLELNPDNPEGWRMLGWSYFATDRLQEAVEAYSKAIELKGEVAEYRSAYGEVLVKLAHDKVTPAAMTEFETALALDPGDTRAKYFIGLAKLQDGDARAAYDIWEGLIKELPPNVSFEKDLHTRMAALSKELGRDAPATKFGDNSVAKSEGMPKASAGEPGRDMDKIMGMVEGLAQRLKDDPDDPDGWRMLGKSYAVLGNHERAVQAYARLVALLPDDHAARRQYAEALLKTVPPGAPYPPALSGSLDRLLRLNSKDEFALFHLGEASSRAGNQKLAAKYWQSLLALLPRNSSMRATVSSKLQARSEFPAN